MNLPTLLIYDEGKEISHIVTLVQSYVYRCEKPTQAPMRQKLTERAFHDCGEMCLSDKMQSAHSLISCTRLRLASTLSVVDWKREPII
jgi:hypothetical protein